MPPWILAAITAFLAALPVVLAAALVAGPVVLPLYLRHVSRLDRERLLGATKAAYLVVSQLASRTPTTIDDDIAKIIKMVEDETGKSLKEADRKLVANAARAMHADPSKPSLSG